MLLIPRDKRKACSLTTKWTAKHQTSSLFNDSPGVLLDSCCVHFPALFGVPSALRHTQTAAVLGGQKWRLEGVCVCTYVSKLYTPSVLVCSPLFNLYFLVVCALSRHG